jgi:ribose transport system permease protein
VMKKNTLPQAGLVTDNKNNLKSQLIFAAIFVAAVVVVFLFFNLITHGNFLEWTNIKVILSAMVWPTFMAYGMSFLFACGYNDLSWGGIVVLASFATGAFGNAFGLGAAIIAGFAVGTILVFINFCVFAFTKIPSWVASLALAMIYEAIGVFLRTNRATTQYVEPAFKKSLRVLGTLPWSIILLIVGLVILYFIFNRTNIGFNLRAIGGNEGVAKALGVDVVKTLILIGLICGVIIGATSFLQESYSGYTTVKSGLSSIILIFKPLAIAMLAEILQKRINVIIAVPICGFLMYSLFTILTQLHVPDGTLQEALLAGFIITFAIIGQRGVKEVVK